MSPFSWASAVSYPYLSLHGAQVLASVADVPLRHLFHLLEYID